jgi:raffinose/stachyose/melibiose transport system substrate-binding protein
MFKKYFLPLAIVLVLISAACVPVATPAPSAPEAEAPAEEATAPAEEAPSGEVIELSFWTEWDNDPMKSVGEELVQQFNDTHPNIQVTHRPIENEQFFTALRTGFTSGQPPDVFQHEANNNLFQFVVPGEVEDISDWWAENGDRFLPGTESAISYDGKYYGVPTTLHTATHIYYNAKMLEELGIDPKSLETWGDYLAVFEDLKQQGITPIAFGNKFGWSGSQWFFAFLVRWIGAEKVNQLVARNCDYKWTDPDFVEAAQLYVDLAENGYFSSGMASDDYPSATALFFAGKTPFFHTGSWFVSETLATAPPDFVLGINKFPMIEGGKGEPTESVLAVLGGLAMSKKAGEDPQKREAALTFIDWFTQLPQAQYLVENAGEMSTVEGALNDETANPYTMQIVQEQIEGNTGAIAFIEHVLPKTVGEEAIWMGSVGVLTGQLDAESWMQSVEDEAASQDPTLVLEPVCE